MKLQADYGEAVMYSKGFSAEETRVAWARAAELAAKSDDFRSARRFATVNGPWRSCAVNCTRRRSWRQRSCAKPKMQGALWKLASPTAASASSAIIPATFLRREIHCERALDGCRHERDLEARERFSDDTGAVAMSILAITSWQLGEVERANELINMANQSRGGARPRPVDGPSALLEINS